MVERLAQIALPPADHPEIAEGERLAGPLADRPEQRHDAQEVVLCLLYRPRRACARPM